MLSLQLFGYLKSHKKYQSRNKSSFETKHEIAVQTAKWRKFFFLPKNHFNFLLEENWYTYL